MEENAVGLIDFSFSSLASGFIFGVIGIYVLKYGRKAADIRFIGIGFALLIYPYLTKGALADWGVGAGLCALGYYLKDR